MNEKNMKDENVIKIRIFRFLLPLFFFGAAATIFLLKMSSFENVAYIILKMPPWLVCFAVAAQILSYLGSGYTLKVIIGFGKSKLSIARGALITMASATIGLAGGWISSAATTYYLVPKDDESSSEAVLTAVMPAIYNSTVLVIVALIGMVYLIINHELTKSQEVLYGFILGIIITGIVAFFYAINNKIKVKNIILKSIRRFSTLYKNHNEAAILKNVDSFFASVDYINKSNLTKPALGAVMNIIFDILTLYLLFAASGYFVKPSVLLAGYSIAFLMGRSAFFVPGGAGVVEGGMVAVFTNLGLPADLNVAVVLSYRFISFWLPSLLGFAAIIYLKKTPQRKKV